MFGLENCRMVIDTDSTSSTPDEPFHINSTPCDRWEKHYVCFIQNGKDFYYHSL